MSKVGLDGRELVQSNKDVPVSLKVGPGRGEAQVGGQGSRRRGRCPPDKRFFTNLRTVNESSQVCGL